jgi:RNA polymerase sigma-70 factor (ECF subfamily)
MLAEPSANPDAEAALVLAVQAGDTAAFEPLVDAHLDHLRAFIALKLPHGHLVDEIAHEAFVFAFRHISGFTAGTSLRGWLRAIAANLIRAELQRFRREQENQLHYARHLVLQAEIHEPDATDGAEVEHLRDCVHALPAHLQDLVAMRYREELPIERIAAKLDRTQTNVWQMLFRMRQQLRQCIEGKTGKARA